MRRFFRKAIGVQLLVLSMIATSFASVVTEGAGLTSQPKILEEVLDLKGEIDLEESLNKDTNIELVDEPDLGQDINQAELDIDMIEEDLNLEEDLDLGSSGDLEEDVALEKDLVLEEELEEDIALEDQEVTEVMTLALEEISGRGNTYPIILVHGFLGWGRKELDGGFKYWGGDFDLQQELNNDGYSVYTAAVGPVSSNWDRACELYAQLTGTRVDYGQAHADEHGHERYGRNYGKRETGSSEYEKIYENIFESQGSYEAYEISNVDKIHLLGHSQGGQTVRVLEQLLREGSEKERDYGQNNLSPLFEGGHDWVASVTTVAAPNDGTTAADANPIVEYAAKAFSTAGTASGSNILQRETYDFKLDQWGLKREPGESQRNYVKRVLDSKMWEESKDVATYDLATWGAKELNEWVKAGPETYYFSWSVQATRPTLIKGHHLPDGESMNKLFYPNAIIMGRYERDARYDADLGLELEKIDKKWWPNDGYVNTISSSGPKLGSNDVIKNFDSKNIEKGVWNALPVITGVDHEDILGREYDKELIKAGYSRFFDLLKAFR